MATLHNHERIQHDYRFLDKSGRTHWVRDELRLLPADGQGGREALGAWHDITDQKQSEQVQQARIAATLGRPRVAAEGFRRVLVTHPKEVAAILNEIAEG